MDLLKKHYEKILLGAVLLGLVVGAAFLPVMISSERQALADASTAVLNPKVKPLEPPDLAKAEGLLQRMQTPLNLNLSSPNKLFNPMLWQKTPPPDSRPVKVQKGNVGVEAVTVTKIEPLYLTITLDSISTSDSGTRYVIGVVREAAATPALRRKKQYYTTLNSKNDTFTLREVKGAPDNPTELVLELNDTGERAVVKRDVPFQRADGYTADLKYEPEKKTWLNRRANTPPVLTLDGEDYIIVAIGKNEVILSAKSNDKKTPIPFVPNP